MDKIETHITKLYIDIQKQLPKVCTLSFGVAARNTGGFQVYGFLHTGERACKYFDSILELQKIIQEEIKKLRGNPILYRNFRGVI